MATLMKEFSSFGLFGAGRAAVKFFRPKINKSPIFRAVFKYFKSQIRKKLYLFQKRFCLTVQLFQVPEKSSQELPLFLEIMLCFLEFSHLKPNETVKSSIVTLHMTFEKILKDFKVSYLAKTQVLPIAFAQVPTISQLYQNIYYKSIIDLLLNF